MTRLPKLLFIIGKGGVGKTTISASLAAAIAARGRKALVVQWALHDAISPIYSQPECSHSASVVPAGFKTMNFDLREAIREYFVEHLKMRLVYSTIVENKYVQKLIQAGPGIAELFFLGRLFWLVELAEAEQQYDYIIVDAHATGHGLSLFTVAPAVARLGITGPLAHECDRVTKLLQDKTKTGIFYVTLPEELPVEETFDSIKNLSSELRMSPRAIFVNQSILHRGFPDFSKIQAEDWWQALQSSLASSAAQGELNLLLTGLLKRNSFETRLRNNIDDGIPIISLPDCKLLQNSVTSYSTVVKLTEYLSPLLSGI